MESTKKKDSDCILWGAYSWGNTGDEILLAVALHDLNKICRESVAVLSPNPEYTKWLFPAEKTIRFAPVRLGYGYRWLRKLYTKLNLEKIEFGSRPRRIRLSDQLKGGETNRPEWVKVIESAEELYLVGGGYLTDVFNLDNLLLPLEVARHYDKKIRTAPIQLGPFKSERSASRVAKLLMGSTIVVRDSDSLEFCRKWSLKATLTRDDCFRVPELFPEWFAINDCKQPNVNQGKIGICVTIQPDNPTGLRFLNWIQKFLSLLGKNFDRSHIEGFCFYHLESDFENLVRVFDGAGLDVRKVNPHSLDFKKNIQQIVRCAVLVTTRFHAAVIANLLGIPFLGLSSGAYYTSKMNSIVERSECLGRLAHHETTSAEEAANYVLAMYKKRGSR